MSKGDRYVKLVEWSEADSCFIGSCPELFYGGCHGDDPRAVFDELCQIVEEMVEGRGSMNERIRTLLDRLRAGLRATYGEALRGVYLYGSYARGEEDGESDVDVLVVLERFDSYGTEVERTGGLVALLSLEYNLSISTVFVKESEWHGKETPFLTNVREEAIPA